jgi:hypothetical protein
MASIFRLPCVSFSSALGEDLEVLLQSVARRPARLHLERPGRRRLRQRRPVPTMRASAAKPNEALASFDPPVVFLFGCRSS